MIWNWFKNVIFFPVIWFWKQYQKCKEENAVGKMVALFGFSFTGLVCIGVALVWLISFLINSANAHPGAILIVIGIIWIYLYGKSKMEKNQMQNQQVLMQQEQDLTFSA